MTRKQALTILGLKDGATADDIKKAYRHLAFSLHPDLNPGNPDAGKQFQSLNEAYVLLSSGGGGSSKAGTAADAVRNRQRRPSRAQEQREATEKARTQAYSAYEKARQRFKDASEHMKQSAEKPNAETARPEAEQPLDKDEVLRDLLRDPFARRVFEDIYSQIKQDAQRRQPPPNRGNGRAAPPPPRKPSKAYQEPGLLEKTADNVSSWLRKQIDEELTLPVSGPLTPGRRVRLQINHGLFGKNQTVEVTLPPEFEPGKPIRLKGLGKQVGKWRGDLYLRIVNAAPKSIQ